MSEETEKQPEKQPPEPKKGRAAHLKKYQFKPGQTGNPNGRPKGKTMRGRLRKLIKKNANSIPLAREFLQRLGVDEEDANGMDLGEAILYACFMKGMKGNPAILNTIFDRIDGKAAGTYVDDLADTKEAQTIEEEREQALRFYRAVLNSEASISEKMKAQQRIDEIVGLTQVKGAGAEEMAAGVREALGMMRDATFGDGDSDEAEE